MSTPFIAEVVIFAGNFAPRSWAFCDGQLLAIAQNTALFSLLGTIYGGDGRTSFALPDLRGRVAIGPRTGPGLPTYKEGQRGGSESVVLTVGQMPSHNHVGSVSLGQGVADTATGNNNFLANNTDDIFIYDTQLTAGGKDLAGVEVGHTGSSLAHNNMQPYLAINYIIALQGLFPSRN